MSSKANIRIIEAAHTLFMKYGIKKTNVGEICEQAGTSKMTFYRNFKNKEVVAKQVLQNLCEEGQLQYKSIMEENNAFAEKMTKLVEFKRHQAEKFSVEFINDIHAPKFVEIKTFLDKTYSQSQADFLADLVVAQQKGEIRADINISFIPRVMALLDQQIADASFLAMYASPQEAIMEVTNFFLYGIFDPAKSKK